MTKYPLLKEDLKISEDLKYNEFPETFPKLHTKGYLYPKYVDGLSLVPKFEFLRVKLLDYITKCQLLHDFINIQYLDYIAHVCCCPKTKSN